FYLLKMNYNVAAALVLSLALFKPQLPVVLAIAILAVGRKRFFAWFTVFGSALTAASMAYVGRRGIGQIIQDQELAAGGVPMMPNLRGLLAFSFHADFRWLAIALLAAGGLVMLPVWRRSRSLEFAVATSI